MTPWWADEEAFARMTGLGLLVEVGGVGALAFIGFGLR